MDALVSSFHVYQLNIADSLFSAGIPCRIEFFDNDGIKGFNLFVDMEDQEEASRSCWTLENWESTHKCLQSDKGEEIS